ncbi:MAG: hypothetical protein OEM02_16615, partial [Desulfobulbaceae bacterium]|nr:hypothetical protein [Desulfobulbaceae bacterium]
IVTRDEFTGKHRLFLDGHIQFAEIDEYRYHEALVHPIMSIKGAQEKVLVLGGGDGMAAREILKYDRVNSIDLVDIDPEVTSLCGSYPAIRDLNQNSLANPKLTIHNVDAWQFVKNSPIIFDRIIIDLPDPHNEVLNKLYSVEFYKLLKNHMSPNGYLVTQSTSPLITKNTFWSIASTLEAAGMKTFSYQVTVPSFSGTWGFNIGSTFGAPPDSYQVAGNKTKFLTSAFMDRASVFAKDELPDNAVINSIFEPKLYMAYNKDVSNW